MERGSQVSYLLDHYERMLTGDASAEECAVVQEALTNPDSELSVLLDGLRNHTNSLLDQAFEAGKGKGGDERC